MKPSKLVVYYFSGTGNARTVAMWLADAADEQGIAADVLALEALPGSPEEPPEKSQLTAFVFPTHGFSASPKMLSFVARFPHGQGKVMLLNTRGGTALGRVCLPGLSGMALLLPAVLLRCKGYQLAGMWPVDMPSNWISLHPALRGAAVSRIFNRCQRQVDRRMRKVLAGERIIRCYLSLPLDLLLVPIALMYLMIGRYALAKTFIATESCNGCGLCVRECPTTSLLMVRERPWWKFSCESCMRCMNICPQQAIETSHGFSLLLWLVICVSLPPLCFWLVALLTGTYLSAGGFWASLCKLITYGGPGLLAIAASYRLLHRGMAKAWVARLIAGTSLTHLPWWGRYLASRQDMPRGKGRHG